MTRFVVKLGAALACVYAIVTLLALVISQALPDAGAIGFLSYADGNPDFYVLDIARRTLHNLTDNDAVNDRFAFSPDGTKIAFQSNKDGNTEIYMMSMECPGVFDPCGGGVHQLTDDETDSRNPVWSPDGSQIAYVYDVSFEDSNNDIYVLDVESGAAFNLSNSPANDESPAWSPDGKMIAFLSDRDENPTAYDFEIYLANPDGSDVRRLMEQGVFVSEYAWSPDGRQMLLVTYDEFSNMDVAMVDSDGRHFQALTRNPEQDFLSPTWSPDSSHFAVIISEYGAPRRLLAFDRVSQTMRQLAEDVRYNSPLAWSSDERYLFFAISHVPVDGRADEIWMADVASSSLQQLTFEGGSSPVWWP